MTRIGRPVTALNEPRYGLELRSHRSRYRSRVAPRGGAAAATVGTSPFERSTPVLRHRGPLTWAVSIFLVLQIGAGTLFVQQAAIDFVRIAGLLVLLPFVVPSKRTSQTLRTSNQIFQARDLAVFKRLLAGYALWAFSSTLLHGEIGLFITHIVGSAFLLIVVQFLTSDGGATVRRILPLVLGSAVGISIGMGLLDPAQGLAGDRLRGVFINANLLGFYAFVTLIVSLLLVRTKFWSLTLLTLSILAIVWTGSRTSAIAAASAILLLAACGNRRSRLILWVMAGVTAVALIGLIDLSTYPLLRSLDTRDGSLEEAARVALISPLIGIGVSGGLVEVASSPLRAFVEGGFVALIGIVVMYLVLLREAIRRNAVLLAVSVAAIISSFGEGWFLSSLGGMMLVFVATWIGLSAASIEHRGRPQKLTARGQS